MDAASADRLAEFWAPTLGMRATGLDDYRTRLDGSRENALIWIDPVPERKAVKHRVHLDVEIGGLGGLRGLGATELRAPTDEDEWWVMSDPEGGEFCAFLREDRPRLPGRLLSVVVDSVDPVAQAAWWAEVLDLPHEREPREHFAALEGAGKLPFDFFCFVPVPEPKAGKNRIHWDLACSDVSTLVAHGARILREPSEDISWHVMADPEGNEFCAFTPGEA
jgi:hypothetical protein